MREKLKLTVLLLSSAVVAYGLLGGLMQRVSAGGDTYVDLSVFTKVINHIQKDYVENPDMEKALKGALHGMMATLDSFSSFVDQATYDALTQRRGGARTGILLSRRHGYAYIVAVGEGSPAGRAGLRSGDLVESIDNASTFLMSVWEAQRRLEGEDGSEVTLRVIRSRRSVPEEMVLTREKLERREPSLEFLEGGEVGYVRVSTFEEGAAEVMRTKLEKVSSTGAEGLLVDLRSCAEGELLEAVAMSDAFLPSGVKIAELRGPKGSTEVYASNSPAVVAGIPVVVLVDGGTSGPAEVFAAALRDNGVAEIVGDQTNGHGSVQEEFVLENGSRLFISTRLIARPNGELLQQRDLRDSGLEPDVRSPEPDFSSNFYFDYIGEDESESEEELDDAFYAELDRAIGKEQLRTAVDHLRGLLQALPQKIQGKTA